MPHNIYQMSFTGMYPLYVAKAEKKDRTKAQADALIHWLTGYDAATVAEALADQCVFETFCATAAY